MRSFWHGPFASTLIGMSATSPVPAAGADFGGVRRKLGRAKERLDKLRSEVNVYLETQPCRIEDKVDGTTYSLHTFVDHEPDDEWVIDMAEVANLLRSVLDQARLATRARQSEGPVGPAHTVPDHGQSRRVHAGQEPTAGSLP